MEIEKMIDSLGLDCEMFDARDIKQIQRIETKKKSPEEKSKLKIVPETTKKQEQRKRPDIPTRCLSCLRRGIKYGRPYCNSNKTLISWPLEKLIPCDQFELMRCRACGLYENGLCTAYDNNIGKSPEDECEYDAICFM